LLEVGRGAYQQHSDRTSGLLRQLFQRYEGEKVVMPFTWEDFDRWYIEEHFPRLTPDQQRQVLERLSPEQRRQFAQALTPAERLEGLSPEQLRQYLDRVTADRPSQPPKRRRKK
jgi:hypothetical protein